MSIVQNFLRNLRQFKGYVGKQLIAAGRWLTKDEYPAIVDNVVIEEPGPREEPVFIHIEIRLGLALAPGVSVGHAVGELEYSINTPLELGDVVDTEITSWENDNDE
jgi:hypothetical protein